MDPINRFPFTPEDLAEINDAKRRTHEARLRDEQNGIIRLTRKQVLAGLLARCNSDGINALMLHTHLGGQLTTWSGVLKALHKKELLVTDEENPELGNRMYRVTNPAELDKQIVFFNQQRRADLIELGYDPTEVEDISISLLEPGNQH